MRSYFLVYSSKILFMSGSLKELKEFKYLFLYIKNENYDHVNN